MDQGKRVFERSEFAIDPTLNEHRNVPVAKRRDSDCGSPFFWLLFFGEAKKSDLPPGNPGTVNEANRYKFNSFSRTYLLV